MNVIQGSLIGKDAKITIIVSRFNSSITDQLLSGALGALKQHEVQDKNITVIHVPGAYEIPQAAMHAAKEGEVDGIVALGCVIRGATPHFDYVCEECARGIMNVSLATGIPIGFGVLTTDTIEQAVERSGTKAGNKGIDAALTTLDMISVIDQL